MKCYEVQRFTSRIEFLRLFPTHFEIELESCDFVMGRNLNKDDCEIASAILKLKICSRSFQFSLIFNRFLELNRYQTYFKMLESSSKATGDVEIDQFR